MLINAAVFTRGCVVVSGGYAPVFKESGMVGVYRISGGTSDQDEAIGRYAQHKVGWAYAPTTDDTLPEVKECINQIYAKVGLDDRQL